MSELKKTYDFNYNKLCKVIKAPDNYGYFFTNEPMVDFKNRDLTLDEFTGLLNYMSIVSRGCNEYGLQGYEDRAKYFSDEISRTIRKNKNRLDSKLSQELEVFIKEAVSKVCAMEKEGIEYMRNEMLKANQKKGITKQ